MDTDWIKPGVKVIPLYWFGMNVNGLHHLGFMEEHTLCEDVVKEWTTAGNVRLKSGWVWDPNSLAMVL